MIRVESIADEMQGYVTYELKDGRCVRLDLHHVREYGAAKMLREMGLEADLPTERIKVVQRGRVVGTLPPDFDPISVKSRSFLYDIRPGDFKRDGDTWIADKTLGPGDLESVPGFVWDHSVAGASTG